MDVKFINPFLYGTEEVMEKMAFLKPRPGKPFAKINEAACGDISGIIGMTGDAIGSLALSFSEACILGIVGRMLDEKHSEVNKVVIDAVGELTNVISGAARKMMEKENLKVMAAIPTIVFGRAHTVRHVIKGPSIVIPFSTECGDFVIDVCLKSNLKSKQEEANEQTKVPFDPKAYRSAVFGKPSMPKSDPQILQEKIEQDLAKPTPVEHKTAAERMDYLKKILTDTVTTRDAILKQLKQQPFMEWTLRQRYKKALPAYEAKIKRIKLDISAAETILKMSREDLENPTIKTHYQHYPTNISKPDKK